jgi:hypothetical protein
MTEDLTPIEAYQEDAMRQLQKRKEKGRWRGPFHNVESESELDSMTVLFSQSR